MVTFTASVDSEGMHGDWNDLLIVAARDEDEARRLASDYVEEHRATRVTLVEVYPYKGAAKVLGTLAVDA